MKLCWDNLENIVYNKKTGKWYKITKNGYKKGLKYIGKCKGCGEPFFAYNSSKSLFCCAACQTKGENNPFYNKTHTEKVRKKLAIFIKD